MLRNGRTVGLLLVALALTGCGSKSSSEPVQFAHLVPRSGADKAIGEHAEHGILLAVEEANQAADQVAGRRVAVLHADTRGDPEVAQSEAVRLVTINRVAGLVGGSNVLEAEPLARIAQQYNLPLVTPAGLPKRLMNTYVFSIGLSPAEQGRSLARFASGEPLQATRLAVLTNSRNSFSAAVAAAFVEELRKSKDRSVSEHTYQSEKDVGDVARSVVRNNPMLVLLAAAGPDVPKLVPQLCQAGLDAKVPFLFGGEEATGRGGALFPVPLDSEFAGEVYSATPFFAGAKGSQLDEFTKKYQERFGSPPDIHAAQAYDAARLLFEACRQAKSFQGAKTREEFAKLNAFESLTGPLSFDKDQLVRRAVFIVRQAKGAVELVQRQEPPAK